MKTVSHKPKILLLLVLLIGPATELMAQPTPPGVPLDFGLSALIAACVGYGCYIVGAKKKDSK